MARRPSVRSVRGTDLRDLIEYRVQQAERERQREPEAPAPFSSLRIGAVFGIRESIYVGITFVKVAERMAHVLSFDDIHPVSQSFPLEFMVFERKRGSQT